MARNFIVIGLLAAAAASGAAWAQGGSALGKVDKVSGGVVVVRGSTTTALAVGDQLFNDDRVLTRADGSATLTVTGCTKTLAASQSITVAQNFCTLAPIALGTGTQTAAAGAGAAGSGAATGAAGAAAGTGTGAAGAGAAGAGAGAAGAGAGGAAAGGGAAGGAAAGGAVAAGAAAVGGIGATPAILGVLAAVGAGAAAANGGGSSPASP